MRLVSISWTPAHLAMPRSGHPAAGHAVTPTESPLQRSGSWALPRNAMQSTRLQVRLAIESKTQVGVRIRPESWYPT